MCNYHMPVCVKCEVEMRPTKNGVGVLDYAEFGAYKLWDADKWGCPVCGMEVVIGFARAPLAEHYEPDFEHIVNSYQKENNIIKVNHTYSER